MQPYQRHIRHGMGHDPYAGLKRAAWAAAQIIAFLVALLMLHAWMLERDARHVVEADMNAALQIVHACFGERPGALMIGDEGFMCYTHATGRY